MTFDITEDVRPEETPRPDPKNFKREAVLLFDEASPEDFEDEDITVIAKDGSQHGYVPRKP